MDYSSVKKDIMNKQLKRFYIFTGEERFVLVKYIQKIVEVSGKSYKKATCVKDCKDVGSSLFADSYCYVCYDDKDFLTNENLWDSIEEYIGVDNMLILVLSSIDKRTKFAKKFENAIVVFDKLYNVILERYVKQNIQLNGEHTKQLIHLCENDCGRLFLEMDKFKPYENADEKFIEFLNDGLLYQPPDDVIFDWVNAMLAGDIIESYKLYSECVRLGEPTLKLLLVLYTGLKRLLQVQSCEGNVEQVTGLEKWEINLVRDKVNKAYSNREIIDAMYLIESVEVGIKKGTVEEETALPYVMVSILS